MEEKSWLPMEAGKFYRSRSGMKVMFVVQECEWCRFAFQNPNNNEWIIVSMPVEVIIGPWIDKPIANWDKMPAWANWIATDRSGVWWWYSEKPIMESFGWMGSTGRFGMIPTEYAPIYDGSWDNSLIERPK